MNFKVFTLLFFVLITGLLSCKNKDIAPVTPILTNLTVVNATADTINYYLNGTRQNNISDLYPGGSTGYLNVFSGLQNYQFKRTGSAVILFSVPYTLDTSKYYSIFVAGTTAGKTFKTVDAIDSAQAILSTDTTFQKSMIRYVNASPDAGQLTVTVGTGDTVSLTNKPFMYVSPFMQFNASHVQSVKVYLPGISKAQIDTPLTFQTGAIYTLFTKGLIAGKGNSAFSISLISNIITQ
jgi:hypothetical protein